MFNLKSFDTVEWGDGKGHLASLLLHLHNHSKEERKKERTGGTTTTAAAAHCARSDGGDSGNCMLNTAAATAAARRTACMRPLCSSERSSSKSCNLPEGQGPSASPDPDIFIMFCKIHYYVNGNFQLLINIQSD